MHRPTATPYRAPSHRFNAEPELYDPGLFCAALNLTFTEDDYFGHPHRMTLSQRDVPGLTRAAIPLLVAAGVKAISVGENRDLRPVNVPPIFKWRDKATGTEMLALFHPGGYGASLRGRQRNSAGAGEGLQAGPEPGATDGLRFRGYPFGGDCVEVPAARTALCYVRIADSSRWLIRS